MNGSESKSLLKAEDRRVAQVVATNNEKREDDDNEWWASDSGSSTGSYYSDSESSSAEWESEIGPTGEVFFIQSLPNSEENDEKLAENESETPAPEFVRRRSTRAGKLMRLIRRRESKRYSTRGKKLKGNSGKYGDGNQPKEGNGNKEVTFRDCQAGEIREVTLTIDPEKRHKLGRRATLCDAYLGISPGRFSDKLRVMVAGFIPDGEAMKNKNIKIGDWLRSINSREVTSQNLEYMLSEITSPTNVKLELQRVAGVEVTAEGPATNFPKQSLRVCQLTDKEESINMMETLLEKPLGVIYLKTTGLSETGPELQGVLYSYPRSESKLKNNILCSSRGAFVTLNHMLPEIIGSQPLSSTIFHDDQEIYILYVPCGEELFLMALPESLYSLQEATELVSDVVRTLEFSYRTLTRCFLDKQNHSSLDHFFYLVFTRLTSLMACPDEVCGSRGESDLNNSLKNLKISEFETVVPAAHFVKLPRDAQIQIDAALNEMEAMDYRDWNEDPMDCQRLYTILGSCLYHKIYLIASHLPHEDLIEIHSFLRQNRLLNLVENEAMKSLIVWRRVYPLSCERGNDDSMETETCVSQGKWFLLVVGFGQELLAVLLECGGCTAETKDNEGPDIFYVEEAQETLKHIQKIGISTLANKWVLANARPETVDFQDRENIKHSSSIAENFLGLIKSSDVQSSPRMSSSSVGRKKTPEVTSILKRRSPEQSPIMSGSVYSLQTSEDSMSQGTGAVSEMSDEAAPILGRRATRERNIASSRHSDDSDSDVDMYRNDSQMSTMDISDIRENLLNQAEYIVPTKLTAGEKNCLLHYVHLDVSEGILLSSRTIENPTKNQNIVRNFNRCAQVIHKLLNNTVRFKKIINEDMDKTTMNKNLIAIKEHGVLFESENTNYWVIGRLYTAPDAKEFYVCYEDSVPQNMIEMAFKLNALWN